MNCESRANNEIAAFPEIRANGLVAVGFRAVALINVYESEKLPETGTPPLNSTTPSSIGAAYHSSSPSAEQAELPVLVKTHR